MPNPQQTTELSPAETAHVPWWPFILAAILAIIIVVLGVLFYISYSRNSMLTEAKAELSAEITYLTEQNGMFAKKIAELQCEWKWDGETCTQPSITLSATPTPSTSPVVAELTARAPSADYTIDYGDGTSGWLSGGTNPPSVGTCTKEEDGMCTFTLKHTYKLGTAGTTTFTAKIIRGSVTEATTDIVVRKK